MFNSASEAVEHLSEVLRDFDSINQNPEGVTVSFRTRNRRKKTVTYRLEADLWDGGFICDFFVPVDDPMQMEEIQVRLENYADPDYQYEHGTT